MNLADIINKGRQDFRTIGQKTLPYALAGAIALGGMSCGKKKSTSPPTTPPKIETKSGVTNSKGQANFTDDSTLEQVVLEVVDKHDKSPIKDMNVTYYDGDGYEVFLIDDPSNKYFPSIGIYPHNSTHVVETGKFDGGIYEIYTIDEDDELANIVCKWKSENNLDFSTYSYERTIDYDEYVKIGDRYATVVDLLWDIAGFLAGIDIPIPPGLAEGVEFFSGVKLPTKPSEIVEHFCPELENPPQRWDIYTYENISDVHSFVSIVPSNIPTINIKNLDVNDDEVSVSWEGADKDTYDDGIIFLPSNKDITQYLDGNSTSDLIYSYRVIKNRNVYDDYDWTSYNSKTSATINIPERGNYTLELRVKDEVDNIGETAVDFLIKGGDVLTGKIAFYSNRDGNDEIYVIDSDGSNLKRLTTTHSVWERWPAWSPDGNKIVFASDEGGWQTWEIYTMNADGTGQTRLTNNSAHNKHPDWSPDGNKIVFMSYKDSNGEIYVIDSDGSNLRKLTNNPAYDTNPQWSPDGSKIIFNSNRDGNDEIYVMNANGTNVTRLTNNPSYDRSPSWSPDGSKIAFVRPYQIYVMNADGTEQTKLTTSPNNYSPTWSPDGTKIAFYSHKDKNFEIYVMNADGTNQRNLTNNPAYDSSPDWSPK